MTRDGKQKALVSASSLLNVRNHASRETTINRTFFLHPNLLMKIEPVASTPETEPTSASVDVSAPPTAAEKKLVTHRTAGSATGAVVGAIVAGPIGAVVGGAIGLVVGGATATPAIKKKKPALKAAVKKPAARLAKKAKSVSRKVVKTANKTKAKAKPAAKRVAAKTKNAVSRATKPAAKKRPANAKAKSKR